MAQVQGMHFRGGQAKAKQKLQYVLSLRALHNVILLGRNVFWLLEAILVIICKHLVRPWSGQL